MRYEVTSAEAAKLLRQEQDSFDMLISQESQSREFNAAVNEDVDSVRPDYSYDEVQKALEKSQERVRIIKHAINVFNTTHEVGDTGMTVDQILVYIPQLTKMKIRLYRMQDRLPKQRVASYGMGSNAVIDYSYANYDIETVRKEYKAVQEELMKIQTALDTLNTSEKMVIELPD